MHKHLFPRVRRYHGALILLHWLLAVAIIAMLLAGHFITAATPNDDPEKINHLRGHMLVGFVVAVLMLVRLGTRWFTDHPPEARSGMAWADAVAPWVHRLMYLLVFVMIGSGMAMSVHFGLPAVVFQNQGALPPDFNDYLARSIHGISARLLALLVLAHFGAALYHQVVRRDGLFSRMGWGPRR